MVCHYPNTLDFAPVDGDGEGSCITLTVDEYETIRLIDQEGLSQEQCGERMHIARTTVQQMYATARKKLADMLVNGLPLEIAGGDYRICSGAEGICRCEHCFKRHYRQKYIGKKGEQDMRVAVTYENGQVFQHFGRTSQFKVYDIVDGKVAEAQVVDTDGRGHGALAGILSALGVDVLICGGIGGGARAALDAAGIRLYGGAQGDADKAVEALLAGTLAYNPDVMCDHHGEHHHGEEACGEHGCGHHCAHEG